MTMHLDTGPGSIVWYYSHIRANPLGHTLAERYGDLAVIEALDGADPRWADYTAVARRLER